MIDRDRALIERAVAGLVEDRFNTEGLMEFSEREVSALLSAARQASTQGPGEGWQPIETAPRDGTSIILFCPQGDGSPGSTYRITEGFWLSEPGGTTEYRDQWGRYEGQTDDPGFDGWVSMDGGFSESTMMPTHWRPLPAPPASQTQEG